MFGGLAKWDGLFFIQIAHEGYLYEKNHAFFPFLPLAIRSLGWMLTPLTLFLTQDEIYLIAAVCINWLSFIAAVNYMKKLTFVITNNEKYSTWICYAYLLSPAGIFLTAV